MTDVELKNEIELLTLLQIMRPSTSINPYTICSCCATRVSDVFNKPYNMEYHHGKRMPADRPEVFIVSHWTNPEALSAYMDKQCENIERFLIPDKQGDALLEWRDV